MTLAGGFAIAVGAGIATFFSPCTYALLPGYIGYYVSATDPERGYLAGAVLRGLAAAGGVLLTFGVLGGIAILAGSALEATLPVLEPVVGGLLIVLGLVVLYRGSLGIHVLLPQRRTSVAGFGIFGTLYALAATACVLPVFLATVVHSLTLSPVHTAVVMGIYGASFGSLMLATTIATAIGYDALTKRVGGRARLLTRLAGVLIVGAGMGQIYVASTFSAAGV